MNKAFTLLELTIVIIIVSVLTVLALPQLKAMLWQARFVEVYKNVGAIARAQTNMLAYYGLNAPMHSWNESKAGALIPTNTRVQKTLKIEISSESFFQYLVFPNWASPMGREIYFKEPGYDWAWTYRYWGPNPHWKKYTSGDGGEARKYFKPAVIN